MLYAALIVIYEGLLYLFSVDERTNNVSLLFQPPHILDDIQKIIYSENHT